MGYNAICYDDQVGCLCADGFSLMLILYSGLLKGRQRGTWYYNVTCSNLELFGCAVGNTWIAYVGSRGTVTPGRGSVVQFHFTRIS